MNRQSSGGDVDQTLVRMWAAVAIVVVGAVFFRFGLTPAEQATVRPIICILAAIASIGAFLYYSDLSGVFGDLVGKQFTSLVIFGFSGIVIILILAFARPFVAELSKNSSKLFMP